MRAAGEQRRAAYEQMRAADEQRSAARKAAREERQAAVRKARPVDPGVAHLKPWDGALAKVLAAGHTRLIDADFLRSSGLKLLARRQDLEQRERAEEATIFLSNADAAAALRSADRRVCLVAHGWRTCVHPDPDGAMLAALLRFLRHPLGAHVVGVFVDFACLHQPPRTDDEVCSYQLALGVMAKGLASPLGTTVARCSTVPPCPPAMSAVVCVRGPGEADAAAVKSALQGSWLGRATGGVGGRELLALEFLADVGVWRAEFESAAEAAEAVSEARAAAEAPPPARPGDGTFAWCNALPMPSYGKEIVVTAEARAAAKRAAEVEAARLAEEEDAKRAAAKGRSRGVAAEWEARVAETAPAVRQARAAVAAEAARVAAAGRGWPTFESGVCCEMVAQLSVVPTVAAKLSKLPAKLIEIGDRPRVINIEAAAPAVLPRLERIGAALRNEAETQFTACGDREVVARLFDEFVVDVHSAMAHAAYALGGSDFTYQGQRNRQGQREGRGIARSEDRYEGEWKADLAEGRGTLRFAGGDEFEGEFVAGEQEGRGTLRSAAGSVYEGQWKASARHGQGVERFADGACYSGEFRAGAQHGQGRLEHANGDKCEGTFEFGGHVHGTRRWAESGDTYEGEFSAALPHGVGELHYAAGVVHRGAFHNGLPCGTGLRTEADSQTLRRGEFDGGELHGIGEVCWRRSER